MSRVRKRTKTSKSALEAVDLESEGQPLLEKPHLNKDGNEHSWNNIMWSCLAKCRWSVGVSMLVVCGLGAFAISNFDVIANFDVMKHLRINFKVIFVFADKT